MKKSDVRDEFTKSGSFRANGKVFPVFYFLLRYVAPVGIVVIFITNFLG